jgi:hypothetical protein
MEKATYKHRECAGRTEEGAGVYVKFRLYIQENFDKRDNLQRENLSKRDKFPCYLTTISGKKWPSGKVIFAILCPDYRSSTVVN